MGLSSIISRVLPVAVAAVTGGPAAAFTTAISVEEQKKQEKKQKQQINARNAAIRQENAKMAEIFGTGNVSSIQPCMDKEYQHNKRVLDPALALFFLTLEVILLVLYQISFLKLDHLFLNNQLDNPPSRQDQILEVKKVNPLELQRVL